MGPVAMVSVSGNHRGSRKEPTGEIFTTLASRSRLISEGDLRNTGGDMFGGSSQDL